MREKRVILRFVVGLCFLCLEFSVPNFALGDSTKASQTPATDIPKKEEAAKSTPAPVEIKPVPDSKPVESKSSEAKPSNEAKADVKDKVVGAGVEKKREKPDTKSKLPNPNKKGSAQEGKKVGSDKNVEASSSSSPKPLVSPSQSSSPVNPSVSPSQSSTSESLADHFVRLEKSDGNKATLVVSGPKLGSTIKITITSKGSKK